MFPEGTAMCFMGGQTGEKVSVEKLKSKSPVSSPGAPELAKAWAKTRLRGELKRVRFALLCIYFICVYGYMAILYIYPSGKNNILLTAEFHHYHHHTYKLLEMKHKTPTDQT